MEFIYIDELLKLEINLKCLRRDSQRYSMLFLQHEGTLFASGERIGNSTDVTKEITSFFSLAKAKHIDLVITPEYSTPWTVIKNIISDPNSWVEKDKLWVIGGESITKEEIKDFKNQYSSENVSICFDETPLNEAKSFFDPLIYLFISNHKDTSHLVVVIQFKTHHMGVWSGGEIERNNLIQGRKIYVLRNSTQAINLFSLICSEAMNFRDELTHAKKEKLEWNDHPYLILNPQLNPNPAHNLFVAFRKFVLQFERKEILTINWNIRSKINQDILIKHGSSRSGIFMKSDEIDLRNLSKIRRNHKLGLYYFYYGLNKHAFIFNSSINAYFVENLPVHIDNILPIQSRRDGPEVIEIFSFDPVGDLVSIQQISDLHIDYLTHVGCHNQFFINPLNCPIEKERLACLTTAEIDESNEWFELKNLQSIRIDDILETNLRLTLAEDTSNESITQKKLYVKTINSLSETILMDKNLYPESISDLKNFEIVIGYTKLSDHAGTKYIILDKFKYNVTTPEGERIPATICFLDHPTDSEVAEKFDTLQGIFDHDNNNRGRVVIFYSRGAEILSKSDPNAGKIQNSNTYNNQSFLKDS